MNSRLRQDSHAKKRWYKKWWVWLIIAFVFVWFVTFLGSEDDSSSQSSSNSNSSSKVEKSSSDSDSESSEVAKARVKNTCTALNQQMSQKSELDGFSMKPSDDQFIVTVPSTATSLSNNEQKSVYKSIVNLIYQYDNGTNQGSYVEFDDDSGTPVAHYSIMSDKIKLDE